MTESDDEGLRAQSTAGFYDHSSRLNWRHSLVELPRHQKERERFKVRPPANPGFLFPLWLSFPRELSAVVIVWMS